MLRPIYVAVYKEVPWRLISKIPLWVVLIIQLQRHKSWESKTNEIMVTEASRSNNHTNWQWWIINCSTFGVIQRARGPQVVIRCNWTLGGETPMEPVRPTTPAFGIWNQFNRRPEVMSDGASYFRPTVDLISASDCWDGGLCADRIFSSGSVHPRSIYTKAPSQVLWLFGLHLTWSCWSNSTGYGYWSSWLLSLFFHWL